MEGVQEVEVPSFFLCPISLQIMRDPVTLSTGITYDRDNIEQWIFTNKHSICPMTKQPLRTLDIDCITPNHTLRRLIQAWCAINASEGIERFPTPRPPINKSQILDLIEDSKLSPQALMKSLKKLRQIVAESERNRRRIESSVDAVDFLAGVIIISGQDEEDHDQVLDEALNLLYSLQVSEQGLTRLLETTKDNFIGALTSILRRSNYQSRAYATLLLKSLVSAMPSARLSNLKEEVFIEIVKVLEDKISYQAMKAALQVLNTAIPWGRNGITAVKARTVPVLIELLLDDVEKKGCEMMLCVLSRLSECAEGRAEIMGHAAGIAVVAKKLVRVSVLASERAVRIVHSIAKCSPSPTVLKEMLEVGVVSKLCLLIQTEIGTKTKERVKEMLRMHARVWRDSPCISPQLQCSYP